MKTENELRQEHISLTGSLKRIDERLKNPMASDDSITELTKTKRELVQQINDLEIELSKFPSMGKSFERLLNESETASNYRHDIK